MSPLPLPLPVRHRRGTIDLRHNRPAQDVTILATTAMLVANQELHPDLARQLLSAAIVVNGNAGFFEETGEFPRPPTPSCRCPRPSPRSWRWDRRG
ncbi:MAG: hypothetical protein R2838_02215 [Caldilineaceae bacterium]